MVSGAWLEAMEAVSYDSVSVSTYSSIVTSKRRIEQSTFGKGLLIPADGFLISHLNITTHNTQ